MSKRGSDNSSTPKRGRLRGKSPSSADTGVPGQATAQGGKLSVSSRGSDGMGAPGQDAPGLFSERGGAGVEETGYAHRGHRLRKKDELSVYEEEMDRRYGMDVRGKRLVATAVTLAVVMICALLLPASFFQAGRDVSFAVFASDFSTNVSGLLAYFSGARPLDPMHFKLFKYLIVAIAGAALGISGGVYQGALRNALASPTTLGVISGGTLGAMVFVILAPDNQMDVAVQKGSDMVGFYASLSPLEYLVTVYGQAFCTLVGCFVVVGFVLVVSRLARRGSDSGVVLIVTGQIVAVVVSSAMTMVRMYFMSSGDVVRASALAQTRSASFTTSYSEVDLLLMGIPILVCVIAIVFMRMRLNVLTFDEEEARSMGLATNRTRAVMVGLCTVMTALVIAFCGSIGFVGFVVPHITRRIVGPSFKYYIPATALVGALFLVVAYFFSSFFALDGIGGTRLLTAIIGGAAFVAVALRSRGKGVVADEF